MRFDRGTTALRLFAFASEWGGLMLGAALVAHAPESARWLVGVALIAGVMTTGGRWLRKTLEERA